MARRQGRGLGLLAAVALVGSAFPAGAGAHDSRSERRSLAALPALPAPAQSADAPDLLISLPSVPYSQQVAPVYVDGFERPGRLLYRFDSLIQNQGGALDLYGGADEVLQRIWPGGDPSTAPVPDAAPPGQGDDRFDDGARFRYVEEDTHEHWHFFSAAGYEILVPGEASRVSEKIGFCLYDSFGTPGGETWWFPWEAPGPATWCRFSEPSSSFVRMGLSRGATDRYSSQREFQYVDVTGLVPGEYVLRAEANPDGHIAEADVTDNVLEELRTIPGVRAAAVAAGGTPGTQLSATLGAEVVAPDVPARRSGSCRPSTSSRSCYVWPEDEPVTFSIGSPPAHGTATLDGSRLTYTPAEGFAGVDRLTYTATDARGLVSAPATVELTVGRPSTVAPPPPPPAPGVTASPR
jgi:hypothetical protein